MIGRKRCDAEVSVRGFAGSNRRGFLPWTAYPIVADAVPADVAGAGSDGYPDARGDATCVTA